MPPEGLAGIDPPISRSRHCGPLQKALRIHLVPEPGKNRLFQASKIPRPASAKPKFRPYYPSGLMAGRALS